MIRRNLILSVLLEPRRAASLSVLDWDLLIRQGRSANLLARLSDALELEDLARYAPAAARHHLLSATRIAQRQSLAIQWEIECIRTAVSKACSRCVLLKGAAYVACELPQARGRIFADVDILVAKVELPAVESALMMHGWRGEEMSAYDQRYYRRWMHEIPPMHHAQRGTSIDVHHTILPETARIKVNTPALFDGVAPVQGAAGLHVLQPTDMVLHSATHLFHEGELDNGLRDLFDLDAMLRHFGTDPVFYQQLIERAATLGLGRPLFYALRYTCRSLRTPIPSEAVKAASIDSPGMLILWLLDWCYHRALQPPHISCDDLTTRIARLLLYVRSHYLRMPFHLVVPHLARKAWMRMWPNRADAA